MVGPEGMEKFCEDIGVEPENVSTVLFPVWQADDATCRQSLPLRIRAKYC